MGIYVLKVWASQWLLTRTLKSLALDPPEHLGAVVAVGWLKEGLSGELVAHALPDGHCLLGSEWHRGLRASPRLPILSKQSRRGDASLDILPPLLELVPSPIVPFQALLGVRFHQRAIFARIGHSTESWIFCCWLQYNIECKRLAGIPSSKHD